MKTFKVYVVRIMKRKCKICKDPRSSQWAADLFLGKRTVENIARDAGVSYQVAWKHFREHVQVNIENGQIVLQKLAEEENYVEVLKNLMTDLRTMVTDLKEEPTNQSTVRMKTELIREIRGLIRDMCTLEGTISKGPLIQLNQLTIQFEYLMSYLATDLCGSCRQKIMDHLEKIGIESNTKAPTG